MKTLINAFMGVPICAALIVFAGNAVFAENANVHVNKVKKAAIQGRYHQLPDGDRIGRDVPQKPISSLTAKGGVLHDCVHVLFPQCSKGFGQPN